MGVQKGRQRLGKVIILKMGSPWKGGKTLQLAFDAFQFHLGCVTECTFYSYLKSGMGISFANKDLCEDCGKTYAKTVGLLHSL